LIFKVLWDNKSGGYIILCLRLDVFEETDSETGAFLFQEAFELELDLESFEVSNCFHHRLIPNLIVEICQLSKHSLKNNESDEEF
jgi:hypothetical protein